MWNEASENSAARSARTLLAIGLLSACVGGCASSSSSSKTAPPQATFESPDAAVQSLVGAMRAHDDARVGEILGPGGPELIQSGDDVADRNLTNQFLAAYDKHHKVVVDGASAVLVIGADEWEMPIPVVAEAGKWRFDTVSGKDEVLARRIGENELSVIQVCRAIMDAQSDYAEMNQREARGERVFARKFVSTPGTRDGLYWEARAGEASSPLGELVAAAVAEGYDRTTHEPQPFYGYYYRMLSAQGSAAPGGARSYLDGERMTGGFAAVAWPAKYDNSGVMTFLISDQGILYQRDLGSDTAKIATAMTTFDPGEGWTVVAD